MFRILEQVYVLLQTIVTIPENEIPQESIFFINNFINFLEGSGQIPNIEDENIVTPLHKASFIFFNSIPINQNDAATYQATHNN